MSNLSTGKINSELSNKQSSAVDFGEIIDKTGQTATETRNSNPQKLSYLLENCLFFEIDKTCGKCKEKLREEEVFSGFQKKSNTYTIRCPIC